MKLEFTHKDGSGKRLLLIFAGWGTDSRAYSHIRRTGWDIAVCYDYSEISFPTDELNGYESIYLYAWSLGVAVAESVFPAEKATRAFALNGTSIPVSDQYGIPCAVYEGTLSGLNQRNLQKFRLRMFGGRDKMEMYSSYLPETDDIESLQKALEEVRFISDNVSENNCRIKWDTVFVSEDDRIFSSSSMCNWWEGRSAIVKLPEAHFVDMARIVDFTLPDSKTIGRQFHTSRSTYDNHAGAQRLAADRLADIFKESAESTESILEIGAGTGYFTRRYADLVNPRKITFVDLSLPEPFGVAEEETYVEADAESWLPEQTSMWDAIVSSSAIQWFSDLPRFFKACYERLRKGGVLVVSGFAEGNLPEFDSIRPNPMNYPDRKYVVSLIEEIFGEGEVTEEELRIEFDTPREALIHLKATGVSATHQSAPGTFTVRQLCSLIPRNDSGRVYLTYRPLYIRARKK